MNAARDLPAAESEGYKEPSQEILTKSKVKGDCDIMSWLHVRGHRTEGIEKFQSSVNSSDECLKWTKQSPLWRLGLDKENFLLNFLFRLHKIFVALVLCAWSCII